MPLSRLTSSLAMVSSRTDEGTSAYPADLMSANTLLNFSLKYVQSYVRMYTRMYEYGTSEI